MHCNPQQWNHHSEACVDLSNNTQVLEQEALEAAIGKIKRWEWEEELTKPGN